MLAYSNTNIPDSRQTVCLLRVQILDDRLLSELFGLILRLFEPVRISNSLGLRSEILTWQLLWQLLYPAATSGQGPIAVCWLTGRSGEQLSTCIVGTSMAFLMQWLLV
jgi:hypothetical protein